MPSQANLRAGVFPARWMPDAAYGLGYPQFSYYAALPFYLAGLFALVGLDILTALKLVQALGFVAAALAMYGWMHRLTRRPWAAWLAAARSAAVRISVSGVRADAAAGVRGAVWAHHLQSSLQPPSFPGMMEQSLTALPNRRRRSCPAARIKPAGSRRPPSAMASRSAAPRSSRRRTW